MKSPLRAFTLVEVLLVSSLVAVLGLAIFRSFGNGLKLWAKAEGLNKEAEIAIFLDKMAEDLRSTVVISDIPFKGTGMKISFPSIVITKADRQSSRAPEEVIDQIGAVEYRFDAEGHRIVRRQANYAQALKDRWNQEELSVAVGIDELTLHYEIYSAKGFLFKPEIRDSIPSGVMVEVRFSDASGSHQLKRYLTVPVG